MKIEPGTALFILLLAATIMPDNRQIWCAKRSCNHFYEKNASLISPGHNDTGSECSKTFINPCI